MDGKYASLCAAAKESKCHKDRTDSNLSKRYGINCDGNHAPETDNCINMLNGFINDNNDGIIGNPRYYVRGNCYASWSNTLPRSVPIRYLYNAMSDIINTCVRSNKSDKAYGVQFGSTLTNERVSNRADDC